MRETKKQIAMLRDRRRFYRWQFAVPCILQTEHEALVCEVVNLSFGGAKVSIPKELPLEGADVGLVLHQNDYSISLSAHVFYVENVAGGWFLGVEFYGSLPERSQKLLPLFRDFAAATERTALSPKTEFLS